MNLIEYDKFGRQRIYTDEEEITESNVVSIITDLIPQHEYNAERMSFLFDVEKGKMDLSRQKEIRKEIDIKAIDSIASQVIDFKLGYEHGEPITYIQRANVDATNPTGNEVEVAKDDIRIATLNEIMREVNKASIDSKVARYTKICGVGYKYVVPTHRRYGISPFDLIALNPLKTFIIYKNDAYCTPFASVTYTVSTKDSTRKYGVYTAERYFEFSTKDYKVKSTVNVLGMIPVIEYINNDDMMGSFEKALPLIDALNVVTSDRVNDVCQQVQSILWLHNTKLDETQKGQLVEGGVIQTSANADGKDAKIQYVNSPLKQNEIQTLADSLKDRILEVTGVPKLSDGGNNTGEANKLANGWHTAETQAKTSELTWRASEDMFLEVCLEYLRKANVTINDIGSLKLSDIDYEMKRSENYDIASRVNSFVTLINAGCDIVKSAMYCRIGDDCLQFALDSQDGINKLRFDKNVSNTQGTPIEVTENLIEDTKASESVRESVTQIQ